MAEIQVMIGLLFVIGLHQSSHTDINDVWANEAFGVEIRRLVMTQHRFRQLLFALRFHDIEEQSWQRRLASDKSEKI